MWCDILPSDFSLIFPSLLWHRWDLNSGRPPRLRLPLKHSALSFFSFLALSPLVEGDEQQDQQATMSTEKSI